ncbi:hypothetical protein RW64_16850 [Geobacter sulfurreducens]|nr:hypothetical protein RW64_16850 [Geobacter sulfurreducens]
MDLAEAFSVEPPPLDYVFGGLLAGDVGALVSPGGSGKSFLAFNIAVVVATGLDLTGGAFPVSDVGPVKYLNAEDRPEALRQRLHALGEHFSMKERAAIAEKMTIKSLKGQAIWLLGADGEPVPAAVRWLAKESAGQRLVILDTLRRFHLGDENSSSHMARLLGILEAIADKAGCSFLYLHHTGKAAAISGNGDQQGASRGSSVLVDNARYQINLTGMTREEAEALNLDDDDRRKYLRLVTAKTNNSAGAGDYWLVRNKGGILVRADKEIGRSVRDAERQKKVKGVKNGAI